MNMMKALLFDLDGTLLDSKKSVIEAVYQTANIYKPMKFTYQEIEERFGESFDDFISLLDENKREEILKTYMEHIYKNHDSYISIFPGVKDMLLRLKDRGYKLAVVTNKQRDLAERGLKRFDIHSIFDVIITLDDVKNGKPDPEPIFRACERLGIENNRAFMIGDTLFDVRAAVNAGVKSIVIDWYEQYAMDNLKADYFYRNINELALELEKMKEAL